VKLDVALPFDEHIFAAINAINSIVAVLLFGWLVRQKTNSTQRTGT